MEEDEEFFDPRPPIKQKRSAPRGSRFNKVKIKEDQIKEEEESPELNIQFRQTNSEYSYDPIAIADDMLSGKNFQSDDQELISQVINELKSRISDSNKEVIEEFCQNLEDLKEDAEKTKFQQDELTFLELEIGFAKTDYQIFKHKMLAKETDLIDNLKEHIESLKIKQKSELDSANEDEKPQIIERQKKELEDAESQAEQRISDFHKFIEAELTPYKSKLKKLKAQQTIAQDKDALWKAKHPIPTNKIKDRAAKIIKPTQ